MSKELDRFLEEQSKNEKPWWTSFAMMALFVVTILTIFYTVSIVSVAIDYFKGNPSYERNTQR